MAFTRKACFRRLVQLVNIHAGEDCHVEKVQDVDQAAYVGYNGGNIMILVPFFLILYLDLRLVILKVWHGCDC